MGVDGEGKGNHFGAVGFDEGAKLEIGRAIGEEGIFDQGEVMAGEIEKIPEMRISIDESEVEAAKEVVQFRAGFGKGIRNHGCSATELDGRGEATGGGIMAIPKGGGQDENRRGVHIKPSLSNSSSRRSSD